MKMVRKQRAIDHVQPELGPERVERMWKVIERHEQGRRTSKGFVIGASLAAVAAAVAVAVITPRFLAERPVEERHAEARVVGTGDVLVTQTESTELTLGDGSTLAIGRASALSVLRSDPQEVRLKLSRGHAVFDVSHHPERRFTVEALDARIEVKGTRFRVEVLADVSDAQRVTVEVERGVVEVHHDETGTLATLSAGQTWSDRKQPEPAGFEEELVEDDKPGAQKDGGARTRRRGHARALPSAADLFEEANTLRLKGSAREAAAAYERFRRTYPDDSRAALAAFELGRIRLDALHDPAGALTALRFAASRRGGGFAAEDAEALIVDALSRTERNADCKAAKARFLAHHPKSAQAARVSRLCSD